MKKFKNIFTISAVFLILFSVAIAPIAVVHLNSKQALNKVHKDTLRKEEYVPANNMQTIEKIALITTSQRKKEGIITRQEQLIFGNDYANNISAKIVEQLKKLQEMNVLPNFDFTQKYKIEHGSKITFIDINRPENIVNIWEVTLAFNNFSIGVWMDNETSVIYQFAIFTDDKPLQNEKANSYSEYMNYLELPLERIEFKGDETNKGGYYIYFDGKINFAYKYISERNFLSFQLDL